MVHCAGWNSSLQVETKAFCCLLRSGNCSETRRRWISKSSLNCRGVKVVPPGERGLESCIFRYWVLLTQGDPREKMRFSMLGLSLNIICVSAQYIEVTAWARGTFDRCVLARLPRAQIISGYCIHMRIKAIFQNGINSLDNVIPSLNSAQQDKPTGSTLWTSADGKVSSGKDGYEWCCTKSFMTSSLLNKSNILRKQSLSPGQHYRKQLGLIEIYLQK